MLLHLRTRPGKTSDHMWAGVAMASGALALFATMVTRAGGVWAVSVHTFVVNSLVHLLRMSLVGLWFYFQTIVELRSSSTSLEYYSCWAFS